MQLPNLAGHLPGVATQLPNPARQLPGESTQLPNPTMQLPNAQRPARARLAAPAGPPGPGVQPQKWPYPKT